jgi:amino acid transporter
MSAAPEPLTRRLGVVGLWLLVINGMIGAGIFGAPAEAARLTGAFSPWLFMLCALVILPIMLCFAQLSSYFAGTGGPVLYAGEAFGPFASFQVGWCLYLARLTAFAANSNLLVTTLGSFVEGGIAPWLRILLLLLLCAGLALLNVLSARGAMRWLGLVTLLKFLPLLLLVAVGLYSLPLTPTLVAPKLDRDFGAALLLVLYAYVGFENGLVAAGEALAPKRDVPRALVAALALCAVLYGAIQLVCLSLGGGSLVQASGRLLGPAGAVTMTCGIIASVGGHMSGVMFAVPRLTYRLGLDGQLPRWFAYVDPKRKTPVASILFLAVAGFLLAASGSFVWLAGLSVLTRVPVWLCCIAAIYRLKPRLGGEPGAISLPGGGALPALAIVICVALLTQVSALAYLNAAALVAVGSLLFLAANPKFGLRRHS